jgi:DNA replication protein DnaC
MTALADNMQELGLRHIADNLDDIIALAAKRRFSPVQLLEHIYQLESRDRAQRGLASRLKRSAIGRFKPIADFDWNWPEQIDRAVIEATCQLEFISQARNIILIAAQGLGKTMIAKNLAYKAVQAGYSVLFTTAAKLLLDLGGTESSRALERRLRHYCRPQLLCIDEMGYLSYDNRSADLLFELINRRYEHKSLVLTTNLAFSSWPTIFPNATCTTALIDRVIHHADIITIEGKSYRRREAEANKKRRGANQS